MLSKMERIAFTLNGGWVGIIIDYLFLSLKWISIGFLFSMGVKLSNYLI